jgi:hypothetical protein
MPDRSYELLGVRILECATEGTPPRNGRDAVDLISAARSQQASLIVIPAGLLGDDFFRLTDSVAGEIIQKFVTYGLRLAILGDISRYLPASSALRDFVYESNKGTHVWFVANHEELAEKLSRSAPSTVKRHLPFAH